MYNGVNSISSGQGPNSEGRLVPFEPQRLPTYPNPYSDFGGPRSPVQHTDLFADLKAVIRIAWKQRWLIVGLAIMSMVLGGVWTLLQTPLYTVKVRIQIDSQSANVVEGGDFQGQDSSGQEFLRTEYERLESSATARRVAASLKLAENENNFDDYHTLWSISSFTRLIFQWSNKTDTPNRPAVLGEGKIAAIIRANTRIKPVRGTRMVDIRYSDPNPGRAQAIANAYAKAYIDSNIDKRFQAHSYAKTFLDDQLAQLKLQLEKSEKALLEFAQREQITISQGNQSTAETNLSAANTQLNALAASRITTKQQWSQIANTKAINIPQLISNPVMAQLMERRGTLEAEYALKRKTYKPDFPAMRAIRTEIREINRRVNAQVKTIRETLREAYNAALAQEEKMKARVEELRRSVLELQKRSIQYNILKRDVDSNRRIYDSLLQRRKAVGIAGGIGANNVFVVEAAGRPKHPSSPRLSQALIYSLGFGFGLGLAIAYVRERFDTRLKSVEDLERATGLVTLGAIPKVSASAELVDVLADPHTPVAEAYRTLCSALQFSTEAGLPMSLVVTSATQGEGKSTTALALARYFANLGLKVLLVDGDLRKPSLHAKLGLDNRIGLSNYLIGASQPPDIFQRTDLPTLTFIASGPLPPDPAGLLAGSLFHSLLAVGNETFDLVIVDAPPVVGIADCLSLSNAAEGTVFVAEAGWANTNTVRDALKILRLAKGRVIGSVLTKYDAKAEGNAYGYGYGGQQVEAAPNLKRLNQREEQVTTNA